MARKKRRSTKSRDLTPKPKRTAGVKGGDGAADLLTRAATGAAAGAAAGTPTPAKSIYSDTSAARG
jgi:hypothetical protein